MHPSNQIKVLAYRDKGDWILETKYNIGSEISKRRKMNFDQSWSNLT